MNIPKVMSAIFSAAVYVAMSAACSGKSGSESVVWSEAENSCVIPSVGLHVGLPADGEWIVAGGDSLPGEMVFCALDAERQVLVAAITPSVAIATDHVTQLDREECRRQIADLTRQQAEACYSEIELRPVVARYGDLLRFRQVVRLTDINADSDLTVVYDGIFGVGNHRPFIVFDTHDGSSSGVMDEIVGSLRSLH